MRTPVLAILLLAAACGRESDKRAWLAAAGPRSCLGCHAKLNPGLVADHLASPHMALGLDCADCHGGDHAKIFAVHGDVPPTVCGACHKKAYDAFRRSRHGKRLKGGKVDGLLAHATPAAGGCTATGGCHSIQKVYEDRSVGRCNGCHVSHAFRNAPARDPGVCTQCHGGVDHPQIEAWKKSAHSLPSASHKGPIAGCIDCHDPHDVGEGIVHGLPPVLHEARSTIVKAADLGEFAKARAAMTKRCTRCHSVHLTRTMLDEADRWRVRGAAMLDRAAGIVKGLYRDGLLDLPPEERVPNPVKGHDLRLGGLQVFDRDASLPERLYYELFFHDYPALWRAAYHTDPTRVTWEANDAMKSTLDRLAAVDRRLRGVTHETKETQK